MPMDHTIYLKKGRCARSSDEVLDELMIRWTMHAS